MISAFGVDHGISKSWTKLKPKLTDALINDQHTWKHDTMDSKLRSHAAKARLGSGAVGSFKAESRALFGAEAKTKKKAAHGMYTAVSRLNRAKRVLP